MIPISGFSIPIEESSASEPANGDSSASQDTCRFILNFIDPRALHRLLRRLVSRRDKVLETIELLTAALGLQIVTSARQSEQINQLPPALVAKVREIAEEARGHVVEFARVGQSLCAH
jgi:hypothetical protein